MSDLNPPIKPEQADSGPTLRDVLAPLFRHRRLMLLSFFGVFLGGILAALLSTNQYQAHMQILVKRERVDPVVTSGISSQAVQAALPVTEEEINSEVELLQSGDLLQKVVLATGLQEQEKENHLVWDVARQENTQASVFKAVQHLAKNLSVEAVKKTDLIKVSYKTADPQLAYRVLSTLADSYLEKHLVVHRPPGAFEFFQQETEQYRKNLGLAEARLARFGSEKRVASPVIERDLILQKLSEFDATLRSTQTGIAETQRRIDELESQLKVTPTRWSTQQKASDNSQVLGILEGTLATLELKHTDMMAHYDPDYRPLKDLEGQIARARAQVEAAKSAPLREDTTDANPAYLWLTEELVKSRADLATLQARAAATARNVQLYRQTALDLGQNELEHEDLVRNTKAEEGNFLLYLNKREEARISDALDSKRILNVAIAEAPTIPAMPAHSSWYLVLLGTLLAAVVSMLAAFVAEYMDPTLRTADETKRVLEIPVLAAMPKMQRG
jgi:uncharacterized protein involved in exopolysaccharide biosynthesis